MILDLKEEDKIQVLGARDIYTALQRELQRKSVIDRNKEHLWVVGLNIANRVLYIDHVSTGDSSTTRADPMQVFRVAVHEGASAILLCHNHPSGELKPSSADLTTTDRLIWTGKIIDIVLLDHLIISEKGYFSFLDDGIFDELAKSIRFRYVPQNEQLKLLKRNFEAKAANRVRQEGRREVARTMKAKGYAVKEIAEITGLGELSVKRLKVKDNHPGE